VCFADPEQKISWHHFLRHGVGLYQPLVDPEIMKGEDGRQCIDENAHNELYAFYTGKGDLFIKL